MQEGLAPESDAHENDLIQKARVVSDCANAVRNLQEDVMISINEI